MTRDTDSASARAPSDDEAGLRAALADESPPVRRDAALGLRVRAETGSLADATVERLAAVATADPDSDARQFAVEALGVAGAGQEAVATTLADADPWVRAEAVVAASRVGLDPDRLRTLAVEDDAGPVRRNACIALAKSGDASFDLLADRLKSDPHPPVREYAAGFLPDLLDATDEDSAADATAGDRPETLREGETPTEATERLLAAVLARDPDAHVRARAAAGLGTLGTDRAVDALEQHGTADRSDDVGRAAERALARARGEDPDAATTGRGTAGLQREQGSPPGRSPSSERRPRGPDGGRPARGPGADRAGNDPNRPPGGDRS